MPVGTPVERAILQRRTQPSPRAVNRVRIMRQAIFLVLCTLALSLFVKSFVVQLFTVPSGSMEPTLHVGDKIAVSRMLSDGSTPQRGDVIVFRDPGGWLSEPPVPRSVPVDVFEFIGLIPYHSGEHLVKRVVGEAGDVVECKGPGPLYRNGAVVDEPYLPHGTQPCSGQFVVTVPARSVWVMGDNRGNSADSRFHLSDPRHGSVPLSCVVGKVRFTVWPPMDWRLP
jgi:signal peptidase I